MYHFEYNLIAENDADFTSEAIASVAYNRDNNEMAVEFIDGDNLYVYSGVTESTYNLFVGSESLGKFYRSAIQGKFTSEAHLNGTLVSAEGEQVEETLADWERELLYADTSVQPEQTAEVIPLAAEAEPIFSLEGARRLLHAVNNLKSYDIKWTGDFGQKDGAVAVCKGVMLGIAPDARIMDLSHDVPAYDVENAA